MDTSRGANTWTEFDAWLEELQAERTHLKQKHSGYVSELLFRGQGDAEWSLETTLDRSLELQSLTNYHALILGAKPQLESITGRKWNLSESDQFQNWQTWRGPINESALEDYEYLAYLRHHGFPSPLLDWSRSPYVAAFFAFRAPPKEAERVAIYAYMEDTGEGKGGWKDEPNIHALGPNITAHPRHFAQQSQYTICVAQPENNQWQYAPHQVVFDRHSSHQDRLWKITLPVQYRKDALMKLDRYTT